MACRQVTETAGGCVGWVSSGVEAGAQRLWLGLPTGPARWHRLTEFSFALQRQLLAGGLSIPRWDQ